MKLILTRFSPHLYDDKCAYAYIYYGSGQHPVDHNKDIIHTFYSKAKADQFIEHLQAKVVPALQAAMSDSIYLVDSLDFINNAPHPVILIRRTDNKGLDGKDIKSINQLMKDLLKRFNDKKRGSDFGLFSNKEGETHPRHPVNADKRVSFKS